MASVLDIIAEHLDSTTIVFGIKGELAGLVLGEFCQKGGNDHPQRRAEPAGRVACMALTTLSCPVALFDSGDLLDAVAPVFYIEVVKSYDDRVLLFDHNHPRLVFEQE